MRGLVNTAENKHDKKGKSISANTHVRIALNKKIPQNPMYMRPLRSTSNEEYKMQAIGNQKQPSYCSKWLQYRSVN